MSKGSAFTTNRCAVRLPGAARPACGNEGGGKGRGEGGAGGEPRLPRAPQCGDFCRGAPALRTHAAPAPTQGRPRHSNHAAGASRLPAQTQPSCALRHARALQRLLRYCPPSRGSLGPEGCHALPTPGQEAPNPNPVEGEILSAPLAPTHPARSCS